MVSCAQLGSKKKKNIPPVIDLGEYKIYHETDFVDHLNQINLFLKQSEKNKLITYNKKIENYFTTLSSKIISNNELFFKRIKKVQIEVVKDARPFHFSMPGSSIYISLGLIKKYINHESELAAVIAYELVRLENSLYNKMIILPNGYIDVDRLVVLLRSDLKEKNEIHKWAYYLIKRAGFDESLYLSWLQLMNRNTVDFQFFLGDVAVISREESLFKRFLVTLKEDITLEENKTISPSIFYQVVNQLGKYSYET